MARLRVLTALDTAKTQFYHFKAIIIAGMGLFTDAYDLFCITPVVKLMGRIYYEPSPGEVPTPIFSTMVVIALVGTAIGQVVFGMLGDRMGRRRVYGLALMLMVFGSIGSGFSICRTLKCVLTSLCFFRFWLGVGIGGDYPLSATIMSEFSNKQTRGAFIAAVFSMQGLGILVSSAVTMAVTSSFDRASKGSDLKLPDEADLKLPDEADLSWRLILMFGAVPAVITLYWRMMMPETPRYTALIEQNIEQAIQDMERVLDVPLHQNHESDPAQSGPPSYGLFSKQFLRRHGRDLFACAAAWLILDIVFYSNNLFQSKIYKAPKSVNAYKEAFNVAKFQAIMAVCSTIPGYWATVYFIDRVGRRKIQIMGFLAMSVCLFAIGGPYDKYWGDHINAGFFILYGLTFFFANFGPNTTTFIVPAELFPARFRSTCHGVSGAFGKVGAIIGTVGFSWATQNNDKGKGERGCHKRMGMEISLIVLGGVCFIGAVLSYFYTPETKLRSLEENENEVESHEDQMLRSSGKKIHHSDSTSAPNA